jgi:hypothetical protein
MIMRIPSPYYQIDHSLTVYLNGEIVGVVMAADDEEGWVDQILTNHYREYIDYPLADSEEEKRIIRRTGRVEIVAQNEVVNRERV